MLKKRSEPKASSVGIFVRFLSVFLLLFSCGGCAGINVTHLNAESDAYNIHGIPWNLPMTQFEVTITRHITNCSPLKGTVDIVAVPKVVPDKLQRYVLESEGWFATSDITSDLAASGANTGLNAQSTDTTAEIASNVIGTLSQVLVGVAGKAGAPSIFTYNLTVPNPKNKREMKWCSEDVGNAVPKLKEKKDSVDQLTDRLAEATANVALLTEQAKLDKNLRKKLIDAMGSQSNLQKDLSKAQKELKETLDLTTDVTVVNWPQDAGKFSTGTNPFQLSNDKWFSDEVKHSLEYREKINEKFDVSLAIYELRKSPPPSNPPHKEVCKSAYSWQEPQPLPPEDCDVKGRVPVRLARTGRFLACQGGTALPQCLEDGSVRKESCVANDAVILQLGSIYYVHIGGGIFRSETGVIALDSNGLPMKIQVTEKVAGAQALTGAVKDTATELAALPAQIRGAALAKTKAETDQLTANAALTQAKANATVQADVAKLGAQTVLTNAQFGLATAQANAQTGGVTAKVALLNAQLSLANAQANAKVLDQTSALTAQTTLLNAETAQINAAAALAKAAEAAAK